MTGSSRVTITLPSDILTEIDRGDKNRSRFILEAVKREISRRRQEALNLSLANPHPDSSQFESADLPAWFRAGDADASDLLNLNEGTQVCWVPDQGWRLSEEE